MNSEGISKKNIDEAAREYLNAVSTGSLYNAEKKAEKNIPVITSDKAVSEYINAVINGGKYTGQKYINHVPIACMDYKRRNLNDDFDILDIKTLYDISLPAGEKEKGKIFKASYQDKNKEMKWALIRIDEKKGSKELFYTKENFNDFSVGEFLKQFDEKIKNIVNSKSVDGITRQFLNKLDNETKAMWGLSNWISGKNKGEKVKEKSKSR